jgi:hypothetical protein
MNDIQIINADASNIRNFSLCGYKNPKQEGYKKKAAWLSKRFAEGLKYQILYSEKEGTLGSIEYIPGQYAWRPVEANGYMFIHCIFIIPNNLKGHGYGGKLVETCEKDAERLNMKGVAVVTRKGTWMAGAELFLKRSYRVADSAPPDFELLALRFNSNVEYPAFKKHLREQKSDQINGLKIYTSDQCPYTSKANMEIGQTALNEYSVKPEIIELNTAEEAQNSPCAFGTFCMIHNGEIIADHPISTTRFKNIMNKKSGYQKL